MATRESHIADAGRAGIRFGAERRNGADFAKLRGRVTTSRPRDSVGSWPPQDKKGMRASRGSHRRCTRVRYVLCLLFIVILAQGFPLPSISGHLCLKPRTCMPWRASVLSFSAELRLTLEFRSTLYPCEGDFVFRFRFVKLRRLSMVACFAGETAINLDLHTQTPFVAPRPGASPAQCAPQYHGRPV